MANPQPDKFTRIANEIQEALCKYRIPGEARQVIDVVLRQTYGWNRKSDTISLDRFMLMTGMKKSNIIRAIHKLEQMNLIIRKDKNVYSFQKDFDQWKPLSKKITLSKKIMDVIKKDKKPLSKKITFTDDTKDTTKDTTKDNDDAAGKTPRPSLPPP